MDKIIREQPDDTCLTVDMPWREGTVQKAKHNKMWFDEWYRSVGTAGPKKKVLKSTSWPRKSRSYKHVKDNDAKSERSPKRDKNNRRKIIEKEGDYPRLLVRTRRRDMNRSQG